MKGIWESRVYFEGEGIICGEGTLGTGVSGGRVALWGEVLLVTE